MSKEKAEVLLYVGCLYGLESNVRETTKTFAKILNAAGVDFGFLGAKEKCCGIEQCKIGERGMFATLAEDNIEMFNGLGIKTLVTPCSHCYNSFKEYYPTVGEFNFEVLHITQYMKRLIDEGKIELQELPAQTVTYSDPCNLGRFAGEYDAPREILKAIKGIELREMERNRDSAWCCGAGGGVLAAFPDFATWTAGERIKEAEATGASVLATTCPWCEYNLETGIEIKKSGLELVDVADLVWQSMKKPRRSSMPYLPRRCNPSELSWRRQVSRPKKMCLTSASVVSRYSSFAGESWKIKDKEIFAARSQSGIQ